MPNEIEESIQHWRDLAATERRKADIYRAWGDSPNAALNKADLYERTAVSLEKERDTGVYHCVCCLKPQTGRVHR